MRALARIEKTDSGTDSPADSISFEWKNCALRVAENHIILLNYCEALHGLFIIMQQTFSNTRTDIFTIFTDFEPQ